ncbi:MAG: thioredoxin, partial [Cucumibacter sp.]
TPTGAAAPAPAGLIKASSTAAFAADVIEASREVPVIVDFWAPWCGPCRQLTPALEKIVTEAGGKVKLVKINVDDNQGLAGQLGIQSIPTVFAFSGGKPVDGFMGAIPESEIRRFIGRLPAPSAQPGAAPSLTEGLDSADAALAAGELDAAGEIYAQVLEVDPQNARAIVGMARLHMQRRDPAGARRVFAMLPEGSDKVPGYGPLAKALALAEEAAGLGEAEKLRQRVEASPGDHRARFDLALALNGEGRREEAAGELIEIVRRDRAWDEDGARKKLLELFEAWGAKDPATLAGRRQLSALLFR